MKKVQTVRTETHFLIKFISINNIKHTEQLIWIRYGYFTLNNNYLLKINIQLNKIKFSALEQWVLISTA